MDPSAPHSDGDHPHGPQPDHRIPKMFHSFLTGQPFTQCIVCERNLLEPGVQYMVEKAVKKADVIIEYAMCMGCMQKKFEQLSLESRARIESYFAQHADPHKRIQGLLDRYHGFNLNGWMGECMISGQARDEMEEYTVVGAFQGTDLLVGPTPYIIGLEARAEMSELLSPQTKDEMDNFIDENFGLPPELKDLFKERDLVLV
ncbi:MAG: hypothetical protein AAF570_01365 [Bacteroidota bacterium]